MWNIDVARRICLRRENLSSATLNPLSRLAFVIDDLNCSGRSIETGEDIIEELQGIIWRLYDSGQNLAKGDVLTIERLNPVIGQTFNKILVKTCLIGIASLVQYASLDGEPSVES